MRADGGDLLLTSDSCYLRASLEQRALPMFGWDLELQASILDELAAMEAAGTTLIFGHDPVLSADAQRITRTSARA